MEQKSKNNQSLIFKRKINETIKFSDDDFLDDLNKPEQPSPRASPRSSSSSTPSSTSSSPLSSSSPSSSPSTSPQNDPKKDPRDQGNPRDPKDPNKDDEDGITFIESIIHYKKLKYKEIKNYIKGEVLGRGKFGVVREFIHKPTLKRYAGKIIKKRMIERQVHLRNQITKELQITYHFKHSNVLKVYDLFTTQKKIYMFMEFCFGELAEFLKAYSKLPQFQSKDYFLQIIDGLNYLHSHCIIHRDIKPENILVTPDHQIKLADFGVCQVISNFAQNDQVFGNDGTPLYHPPELFDKDILFYSGSKIDIWAAGVVLYRMLTGELPFFNNTDRGITTQEDLDEILEKNPRYPLGIRENVLLLDLFNRIFEKNFKNRITIMEIKNHPWMQVDYNLKRNQKYFILPMDGFNCNIMDSYRGLTVQTRIYNKYYPNQSDEQQQQKLLMMRSSRFTQNPIRISLIEKQNKRIQFL